MNITLTIDASPSLINLVGLLAGALSGLQNGGIQPITNNLTTVSDSEEKIIQPGLKLELKNTQPISKPEEKSIQQEQDGTPDTPVQQNQQLETETTAGQSNPNPNQAVTLKPEDLRAVAATKDRAKVKALLDKWECKSISAVSENDRAEFLAELRGL